MLAITKEKTMGKCLIKCHVKKGLFDDEMIVRLNTVDETGSVIETSCLAYGDSVIPESSPSSSEEVPATLKANCLGRKDKFVSVVLPQSTFLNGTNVILRDEDVEEG